MTNVLAYAMIATGVILCDSSQDRNKQTSLSLISIFWMCHGQKTTHIPAETEEKITVLSM